MEGWMKERMFHFQSESGRLGVLSSNSISTYLQQFGPRITQPLNFWWVWKIEKADIFLSETQNYYPDTLPNRKYSITDFSSLLVYNIRPSIKHHCSHGTTTRRCFIHEALPHVLLRKEYVIIFSQICVSENCVGNFLDGWLCARINKAIRHPKLQLWA